jgi:hypothetical protein
MVLLQQPVYLFNSAGEPVLRDEADGCQITEKTSRAPFGLSRGAMHRGFCACAADYLDRLFDG